MKNAINGNFVLGFIGTLKRTHPIGGSLVTSPTYPGGDPFQMTHAHLTDQGQSSQKLRGTLRQNQALNRRLGKKAWAAKGLNVGETVYTCRFCGQPFRWKTNRLVHERRHTGEKPCKCRFCPKSFASSSQKASHERLHTGEKPYHCLECGRTFAHSSNLRKHQNIHHGQVVSQRK